MKNKNNNKFPLFDSIYLCFNEFNDDKAKWFYTKEQAENWWGEQANSDGWLKPIKFTKDY